MLNQSVILKYPSLSLSSKPSPKSMIQDYSMFQFKKTQTTSDTENLFQKILTGYKIWFPLHLRLIWWAFKEFLVLKKVYTFFTWLSIERFDLKVLSQWPHGREMFSKCLSMSQCRCSFLWAVCPHDLKVQTPSILSVSSSSFESTSLMSSNGNVSLMLIIAFSCFSVVWLNMTFHMMTFCPIHPWMLSIIFNFQEARAE